MKQTFGFRRKSLAKWTKHTPVVFSYRLGVLLFPQKNKAPLSFHSPRTRVQIMFSSWQTGRVQTTAGMKYLLVRGGVLVGKKKKAARCFLKDRLVCVDHTRQRGDNIIFTWILCGCFSPHLSVKLITDFKHVSLTGRLWNMKCNLAMT